MTFTKRMSFLSTIGAVALCAGLAGCNHEWRPKLWNLRHHQDADVIQTEGWEAADSSEGEGDKEKRSLIRGFYKNNRLKGGLSGEAREIERNFNIDR